jgi:predicted nucleic acid-binding protein
MKLVIDTNEIFSFFNSRSKARDIVLRSDVELFAPEFAITEIERHKGDIRERFALSEMQYSLIKNLLDTVITFCGKDKYSEYIDIAEGVSPDPEDSDFFALAMSRNCPIWSEDRLLKEQDRVKVYTTTELMGIIEWIS